MLTHLTAEGYEVLGLDEAKKKAKKKKKGMGAADASNPKRKALIKQLKKNPNVRNPEGLASYIGRKIAGLRSHDNG